MQRYLTILEVSQKQAYIFASNKLQENITNSEVIARILSPKYLDKVLKDTGYSDEKNMVYSGGGHTILEFDDQEESRQCIALLTETIYRDFSGLAVFAKTIPYKETKSPKENLRELTRQLEEKKSRRFSYFHQGTYGIEKIDATTLSAVLETEESETKKQIREDEYSIEKSFYPEGVTPVMAFEELGGSRNTSNFIAVVHVDGNGMGKRVDELYDLIGTIEWNTAKKKLREFSEGIDQDFKQAFRNMAAIVGYNQENGNLKDLDITDNHFPLRRIITAGDDICFVAEGRIGIECAAIYLEELNKLSNIVDGRQYAACAGVVLVHQKFPFYKAYELAEKLSKNAKSFGSKISPDDNGRSLSLIDWHIEFGEMGCSLKEIRRSYTTTDGNCLLMRPYVVTAPEKIIKNPALAGRKYSDFKRLITLLIGKEKKGSYPNGKIRELRGALKEGERSAANYLLFNRMEDLLLDAKAQQDEMSISNIGKGVKEEIPVFVPFTDEKKYSTVFDAIELMDTYLCLERGE